MCSLGVGTLVTVCSVVWYRPQRQMAERYTRACSGRIEVPSAVRCTGVQYSNLPGRLPNLVLGKLG